MQKVSSLERSVLKRKKFGGPQVPFLAPVKPNAFAAIGSKGSLVLWEFRALLALLL